MDKIAKINPWALYVSNASSEHLFGYMEEHYALGGQSWAMSSPIVKISEDRATTQTGTIYRLGQRILLSQLPTDEAHIALRCLRDRMDGVEPDLASVQWLQACKAARWLSLEPPDRFDPAAVNQFIVTYRNRYLALRTAPDSQTPLNRYD